MKKNTIGTDNEDERVESFLLHEYSTLESKLQHNQDASDSRMKFFITLISSGVAAMTFLPQIIMDTYNAKIFLGGASGVLWTAGFYYTTVEMKNFVSRLEIYYKIFKVKMYFEKYESLKDYIVREREQSWLFEGYKEKKANKQPAPSNALVYLFLSSLFFSLIGYFFATTVLGFYFSFIVSAVLFIGYLVYSFLKIYYDITRSDANRRLSELMNEPQVVIIDN